MMRDDKIDDLIHNALCDAPPAPEKLRHNVMATISELENEPRKNKRVFARTVTAVAGVAVFAVIVIAISPMFYNGKSFNMANLTDMNGSGAAPKAPAEYAGGAADDSSSYQIYDEHLQLEEAIVAQDESGPHTDESKLNGDIVFTGVAYFITGELPLELDGLGYVENPDKSRDYVDVPDDIIKLLLENNPEIEKLPTNATGNLVKWIP